MAGKRGFESFSQSQDGQVAIQPGTKFASNVQKPSLGGGNMFPQSSSNQFGGSSQHQPANPGVNVFAHLNTPQNQNSFGQSSQQQPANPGVNVFAHLNTPQNQKSFGQSSQQQPANPNFNVFAHLNTPQKQNPFGQSSQQQPANPEDQDPWAQFRQLSISQPPVSLFGNTYSTQSQPSNSIFPQFTASSAQHTPSNVSAPEEGDSPMEDQPSTSIFTQGVAPSAQSLHIDIPTFQEADSLMQISPEEQPSSSMFTQGTAFSAQPWNFNVSASQEGDEMQLSPDSEPQPNPVEFVNQTSPQPQFGFTNGPVTQGMGGSQFERISNPLTDPSSQTNPFGFPNQTSPQPQSGFTNGPVTQGMGGSQFERISSPLTDPSTQGNPFGFPNQTSSQPQSSSTNNSVTQEMGGSLFGSGSRPTIDPSLQANSFGFLNQTTSQPQSSSTNESVTQGMGGSLFGRVPIPPTETTTEGLSGPTQNKIVQDTTSLFTVPQTSGPSNLTTMTSDYAGVQTQGTGGSLFDGISSPPVATSTEVPPSPAQKPNVRDTNSLFNIPQMQATSNQATMTGTIANNASATIPQGMSGSLFDRISKPPVETVTQAPSSPAQHDNVQNTNSLFNLPGASITATKNGNDAGVDIPRSTRPTTIPVNIGESKIAKPAVTMPPAEDAQTSYKAVFGTPELPTEAQPSPASTPTAFSAAMSPSFAQFINKTALPVEDVSKVPNPSVSTQVLHYGDKSSAAEVLEEERRQIAIKDQLEALKQEYQRHILEVKIYYRKQQQEIIARNGVPREFVPGAVSKSRAAKEQHGEAQGKNARSENASSVQSAQSISSNGSNLAYAHAMQATPHEQVINHNNKRLAGEELERNNDKKIRCENTDSDPTISGVSPDSHTSGIFKNILDKKQETTTDARDATILKPSSNSSMPPPPRPSAGSPAKPSSTPSPQGFLASSPGNISKPDIISQTPMSKPPAFNSALSSPPQSQSLGPFPQSKPTPTSQTVAADMTKAPTFQLPAFGSSATSTPQASSPFLQFKPPTTDQTSSGTTKAPTFQIPASGSASKAPVFQMPAWGSAATPHHTSPFPQFKPATAGPASSDNTKAPIKIPTSGSTTTPTSPGSSSSFSVAPTKASGFDIPKFGAAVSPSNFMAQFGKAAEKSAEAEKKKRKAEDFDSDEDDEDEWERKYAEEQRAKKQKIENETKGKAAKLIDGKWVISGDQAESSTTSQQAQASDIDTSVLSQPVTPLAPGHNIFGHLSGEDGSKTGDADDENDDEYENGKDNQQKAGRGPFISRSPSPRANPEADDEAPGLSIFDRISSDEKGNPVRQLPRSDGASESSNFFRQPYGVVPSFGGVSALSPKSNSPTGDNTWKVDSPIKFGSQSTPPAVNVTSPDSSKASFSGLFGGGKFNAAPETPTRPASSLSSTMQAKTPNAGFGFGIKPTLNSLAPPSDTASNTTSRATSPGATTGGSANELTADDEDCNTEKQVQLDLTTSGPGEEDEDVIFQVRGRGLKWENKSWVSKGVGPLRVLKNPKSGQTRLLMRQDPSGRVVLNAGLSTYLKYESPVAKIVRMPVANQNGGLETWTIKFAKDEDAKELARLLEENKSN